MDDMSERWLNVQKWRYMNVMSRHVWILPDQDGRHLTKNGPGQHEFKKIQ